MKKIFFRLKKSAGFTLLEVLISLAILSTLGILAAQSIRQSIMQKKKIQGQLDEISQARDALRLIERDINLAYHHLDWEKELEELVNTKKNAGAGQQQQQPQIPQYPGAPVPPNPNTVFPRQVPRVDPTTNFVGTSNEINFVTLNNARLMRNQKQADFMEVGYVVKECKSTSALANVKCLWRRSSPIADEDVTKGGDEVALLENVTEFSLKYLGAPKTDWVETWRTDKQGTDPQTKDRFPSAVEISLTVQNTQTDPPGKKYSLQTVATIHFPNNAPPKPGGPNAPTN